MSKTAFGTFTAEKLNHEFQKRGEPLTTSSQISNKLTYWERRVGELRERTKLTGWDQELYTKASKLVSIALERESDLREKNSNGGGGEECAKNDDHAAQGPNVRSLHVEYPGNLVADGYKNDKEERDQSTLRIVPSRMAESHLFRHSTPYLHIESASAAVREEKDQTLPRTASLEKKTSQVQEQLVDQSCAADDDLEDVPIRHAFPLRERGKRPSTRRSASLRKSPEGRAQSVEKVGGDCADKEIRPSKILSLKKEKAREEKSSLRKNAAHFEKGECSEQGPRVLEEHQHRVLERKSAQPESKAGTENEIGVKLKSKIEGEVERMKWGGKQDLLKTVVCGLISLAQEFNCVPRGTVSYECLERAKDLLFTTADDLMGAAP